jgi:hypothetical protein
MMMLDVWLGLGYVAGSLVSGFAIKDLGYTYPLCGVLAVEVLLIVYTILVIPNFGEGSTGTKLNTRKSGFSYNNIRHIVTSTFNIFFRPVMYQREILLMLLIFIFSSVSNNVSSTFLPVYVMGYPLCWRAVMLSVYQAADVLLHSVAAGVAILLWQRTSWSLYWLMLIGCTSGILQIMMFGLAHKTYLMFLAALLGTFYLVTHPTGQSILSTMVDPRDQG